MSSPPIAKAAEEVAVKKILLPIVRDYTESNQGIWEWQRSGNGGYLIKMSADVNGDGKEEYFYASSLNGEGAFLSWPVFEDKGSDQLVEFADSLDISNFWQSSDSARPGFFSIILPPREDRTGKEANEWTSTLVHYSFNYPHITTELEELPYVKTAAMYLENKNLHPKVEAILLSDFFDHRKDWEEVKEWDVSSDKKLFRRSDWNYAQQNKNFTAADAVANLLAINSRERREKESASIGARVEDPRQNQLTNFGNIVDASWNYFLIGGATLIIIYCLYRQTIKNRNRRRRS